MSSNGIERLDIGNTDMRAAIERFTGKVSPMVGMMGIGPVRGLVDGSECVAGWSLPESDGHPYKRVIIRKDGRVYAISAGAPDKVFTEIDGQEVIITDEDSASADVIRADLVHTLDILKYQPNT